MYPQWGAVQARRLVLKARAYQSDKTKIRQRLGDPAAPQITDWTGWHRERKCSGKSNNFG